MMASAPDFGGPSDDAGLDIDQILFTMQWPEVPVRQMEADVQWWEQIPKENVSVRVVPKHSDAVEQMFPEFCAQNRERQQKVEKEASSGGGWFSSKKKSKSSAPPITTNSMDFIAKIHNPQGANDLISAMNSAVFPGPAILSFKLEASRDYTPDRDAECWKQLAAVFRKCYPQYMAMERMEITGQDIGDEALLFLGAAVGHYPRLHTMDLWENKISGHGAKTFFKAITKNKCVKTINLGKNVLDMNDKTELTQLGKEVGVDVDTF